MEAKRTERDVGVSWGFREAVQQYLRDAEDWIDRMALRLGDAIFGERISEKLFGPHPSRQLSRY